MIHLRRIELADGADEAAFPFSVPALRKLGRMEFTAPVTFFVGENGSGKSTLLEALALKAKLPPATGAAPEHDSTLAAVAPLAKALTLGWRLRTRRGFFLRAEDFFNFARETKRRGESMGELAERFDDDSRVRGYMLAQKHALAARYGEDLHALSHGECFLKFFQARFAPHGLHLIDEPEAALSPQRQLAFLSLMNRMVAVDAQLIIATHSPLLLAFPGAQILRFDEKGVHPAAYDELENVTLVRSFLSEPARFLRDL